MKLAGRARPRPRRDDRGRPRRRQLGGETIEVVDIAPSAIGDTQDRCEARARGARRRRCREGRAVAARGRASAGGLGRDRRVGRRAARHARVRRRRAGARALSPRRISRARSATISIGDIRLDAGGVRRRPRARDRRRDRHRLRRPGQGSARGACRPTCSTSAPRARRSSAALAIAAAVRQSWLDRAVDARRGSAGRSRRTRRCRAGPTGSSSRARRSRERRRAHRLGDRLARLSSTARCSSDDPATQTDAARRSDVAARARSRCAATRPTAHDSVTLWFGRDRDARRLAGRH